MVPYLNLVDIKKSFGDNHVLHGINLSLVKNEFVTLLGPSGCGKTTLLRSIAGLSSLDSGKIILDSEDITYKNPKNRNIGMIFQAYCLFPTLNVFDNVAYGLRVKKIDESVIKSEVTRLLESMDLSDKVKNYPAQLSGGEMQRVALARSLVMKPKILLLDEPFNAIDAKLRKVLQMTVKEIHKSFEMTSILVTHDQDEAMIMSDTIHLFKSGSIEQSGSPADLYLRPKTKYAASFMGNYNVIIAEEFKRITNGLYNSEKVVVLRPETIKLSKTYSLDKFIGYAFKGLVKDYVLQGSMVRFVVETRGVDLNVDVLVDDFHRFQVGENVNVQVEAEKILYFD